MSSMDGVSSGRKKGTNSHWLQDQQPSSRHTGSSRCKNRSPLLKCPNREGRLAEKKSKREGEKGKRRRRKKAATGTWVGEPTRFFWHEAGHAGDKRSLSLKILKKVRKSPKRSKFWPVDRFNGGTAKETKLGHTFHPSARARPP